MARICGALFDLYVSCLDLLKAPCGLKRKAAEGNSKNDKFCTSIEWSIGKSTTCKSAIWT